MLSTTHTLISLPLGVYLANPLLAFTAAFLLHFLADMILHWNIYPDDYPRFPFGLVTLDVGGGLILAYLLLGTQTVTAPILAAILGGNLPDILHSLWFLARGDRQSRRWPRFVSKFFHFHHKIQRETRHLVPGLIPQLILAFFVIVLLTS